MHKILITGSAGLIGSSLAEILRFQGFEVVDCDLRFSENSVSFDSDEIEHLMQDCDGIVHLAAISRVIHGEQYPELCHKVNVEGSKRFLEIYKKLPQKPWLIYGSSREVYGNQEKLPVTENVEFKPVNIYARGKVNIEDNVSDLKKQGYNTAILRFSNVYGGLMDHFDRVVPAFCIRALKGEEIRIDGKECVFDFTYIDDVVEGIMLAISKIQESSIENPIHFTGGRGCSLDELAKIIIDITRSKSKLLYKDPRGFDVAKFYGDYSSANKILGWNPKHSLEEGISKFIDNLKNPNAKCPNDIKMVIYEDIKSYSWLPALL